MYIIIDGHLYMLDNIDGAGQQRLQFVDRGHGRDCEGTTCQEVLRVLIDRVKFLDREKRWDGNDEILLHLRKALILFEMRALYRKVEKGSILPEDLAFDPSDGHLIFKKYGA